MVPFALFAVYRTALTWRELAGQPTDAELGRFTAVDVPDQHTTVFSGMDRDLGFYGLHLVFVVGLIVTLAGIALLRSGPDRRSWRVLAAGLLVGGAAVGAQLLWVDGATDWMRTLRGRPGGSCWPPLCPQSPGPSCSAPSGRRSR